MKKNTIPKLPIIELSAEEIKRKKDLMSDEVQQIIIKEDLIETIEAYSRASFQARKIGQAAKLYYKQTKEETGIIWSMAGSLFGAGLRQITIDCIRDNLVDVLVCTGALFEQDMLEALGHKHYICDSEIDDSELQRLGIDRVYDHLLDEMALRQVDLTFKKIASEMPEGYYSSREYMKFVGKWLSSSDSVKDSVAQAAYEHKIPIFIPAINDSSLGIGIAMNKNSNRGGIGIDVIKDLREIAQLKSECGNTGIIVIGGGVPKNYAQDAVVMAEMLGHQVNKHKFGIQISTADVRDGGLSGSTLKEAISWGKNDSEMEEVMVWGEATVYVPLLMGYVMQKNKNQVRPKRCFSDIFRDDRI